jgi:hypothetical protein
MPYIVKRKGTGLAVRQGSSFGGVRQASADPDTYLTRTGDWTEDKDRAIRYLDQEAAEVMANTKTTSFSAAEVEEVA